MTKTKIGDCFRFANSMLVVDHFKEGIAYAIEDGNFEMIQAADIPLPTLHLPIKGKWFDLIKSGEKKEEYRDISTFYRERLCPDSGHCMNDFGSPPIPVSVGSPDDNDIVFAVFSWRPFKVLHLTHGYGHDKPQLWAHIEEITIGKGNPEWGAPAEDVFIIRLGSVFHTKNLTHTRVAISRP